MTYFSGATVVLFCFVFVFMFSLKPRPTRVSFFFPFVYLEMSLFPSIFCTIAAFSLYRKYAVRVFLPDGAFLSCDHGLDC